jgi:hypothetical protein
MKRIALLTVLLLVVGLTAGFAVDLKPTFALTGSATLTWGINLDTMTTGFTNAQAPTVTITLMPATTLAETGKTPLYGSISISGVGLYWVDGLAYNGNAVVVPPAAVPTVAATLNFDPFVLGIYAAPGMGADTAVSILQAQDTGFANVNAIIGNLVAEASLTPVQYASAGTYLTFKGTGFTVTADISSKGDQTANTTNAYAAGLESTVTFAPITFGAGAFQGMNWGANPTTGYVMARADLTGIGWARLGVDVSYDATNMFQWEVEFSAQMNFNKDATAYLLANVFYTPDTNVINTGMDSALSLMIPANTLIGPVNFDVTAYYIDLLLATQKLGIVSHVGYTQKLEGDMSLAASMGLGETTVGTVSTLKVIPSVVLTLTGAPVTALTFTYTSGDFLATPMGYGTFTCALGITY